MIPLHQVSGSNCNNSGGASSSMMGQVGPAEHSPLDPPRADILDDDEGSFHSSDGSPNINRSCGGSPPAPSGLAGASGCAPHVDLRAPDDALAPTWMCTICSFKSSNNGVKMHVKRNHKDKLWPEYPMIALPPRVDGSGSTDGQELAAQDAAARLRESGVDAHAISTPTASRSSSSEVIQAVVEI